MSDLMGTVHDDVAADAAADPERPCWTRHERHYGEDAPTRAECEADER